MDLRHILRREAPALALAISAFGHSLVARAIPGARPSVAAEPTFVELAPPPPPAPEKPVPPVPAPAAPASQPNPEVPHKPTTPAPQRSQLPAKEAPPKPSPAPAEPLALTGVTLSGDDGSWSTALGNGEAMKGPISPPRSGGRRAAKPAPSSAPSKASGPRVVALGDLSSRPTAPNLNGALRRAYPPAAREQEVSGYAAVRALIGPSGRVASTRVVSESFPGFGAACAGALGQSHWSSPRDAAGRSVATWILYRCNFALAR